MKNTPEHKRLAEHHEFKSNWRQWGPYLSNRSWGTVREDYSVDGDAWSYFPHDHARSRAYRWGEDGIAGISDRQQYFCFDTAFWNGKDPILKERFFGLNPHEGNHGEDVKELFFYLDNTPTHSYMKMLYKYPHKAFPYRLLTETNQRRSTQEPEFELLDTGIFAEERYFDISIEYAKVDPTDILIKITVQNRGSETAPLHILPTLWFRNTWSWGYPAGPMEDVPVKPHLFQSDLPGIYCTEAEHSAGGHYYLYAEKEPEWIFTENETNHQKLFGSPNASPYVKDAFHRYLINQEKQAVNPEKIGTKAAGHYFFEIASQEKVTLCFRLSPKLMTTPFKDYESLFALRQFEADEFYQSLQSSDLDADQLLIQRQAWASLLWSKQLYYYDLQQWLAGDPAYPPVKRNIQRNKSWGHLFNFDIISMPDKWEFPWYASWDLAFHCVAMVIIDPDFTKRQLILLSREWYMHPNGALPSYEWDFGEVNPPVIAWAAWRVYKIDKKEGGKADRPFLEEMFQKLLLNFTWWVNQKDKEGHNVFQGGFLGLDNISIFDRNLPMKEGTIDQADGTAWMGFYCIIMMKMALELAVANPVYQDMASKFFEHFLRIANAMITPEEKGYSLWCEQDGFFYDTLRSKDLVTPLRIRSIIGFLPLLAVETFDPVLLDKMPVFKRRMDWFLHYRPHFATTIACVEDPGTGNRRFMSILTKERLTSLLEYLVDEAEFLSDYGIRSLSKHHHENPYVFHTDGKTLSISYLPGEAVDRSMAWGNSNWRGPIWFPLNFLIIESLQKINHYYGDTLKVEFPKGSGKKLNLGEIATKLSQRLIKLFEKGEDGTRPIYSKDSPLQKHPAWQNLFHFNEFFNADTGMGLGASHQTGWTALIAKLLQRSG